MEKSEVNYVHQSDLFDSASQHAVKIIGAGSVGSYTTLGLAKLGVSAIEVWDHDFVASHNGPMSLYAEEDIGRLKVLALRDHVKRLASITISAVEKAYEGEKLKHATIISCVDTMDARKLIWDQVRGNVTVDFFCDARLAADYVEVYGIEPNSAEQQKKYDALIFPQSQAVRQQCRAHGIVDSSMYAASRIISLVRHYWTTGHAEPWCASERCGTLERVL